MKNLNILLLFSILFVSSTGLADYAVKQINSATATVVVESTEMPLQVPKGLSINLADGDQCSGPVISIQDKIILLDVNKCANKSKIRVGQSAVESIDIAPNDMLRDQLQPVQVETQNPNALSGAPVQNGAPAPGAKPKRVFSVDDGQPHYAFKFHYAVSPLVNFSSVTVGSTSGQANIALGNSFGFKLEYGFYNRKYWNLLAGAGYDLERATVAEEIVLTTGTLNVANGPHLKISNVNLYLAVSYPFQNFYVQGSLIFTMPNISFDNAKAYSGQGGMGWDAEAGYVISERWAAWGSYRSHQVSATARSMGNNDYAFSSGYYSDFLLGGRYIFR